MPDPRSSDLLHQNISDLLGDAASEYDRVVVDTPPFLRSSESLDILRCVDAAIAISAYSLGRLEDYLGKRGLPWHVEER